MAIESTGEILTIEQRHAAAIAKCEAEIERWTRMLEWLKGHNASLIESELD